ncbi:ankyrin repeat domain-containing protein 34B [Myripristis murdjan]|uniref:ankyrin repeat domain-containing protein 34B n=1 Tax=Myripristis murdjan TaxID=586833 RepID=UPI001175CB72|nr:ankyrin repeat domain-containing protein 34B-like [Myripristis murdjan]
MEGEGCISGAAVDSGNPLLRAVFLRRLRLARLLLEGGAYINESDGQGQTPLMVACRTQHTDAQSASRVKLVQYLLERGADPNIQDKAGRSALMHACREQAGSEVVSLLLASGADVGLEDRSGMSALVYAVTAGDRTVLKLLLDTCKAKGKEVIIITIDKFPCGKLQAKQYLSMLPLGQLDQTGKMPLAAPTSPSEIQLIASPQCVSSFSSSAKQAFSFKESQCSGSSGVCSHPCSPSRFRALGEGEASRLQQPLLRLNSEPWLKIPASLLAQKPHSGPSSTENLPELNLKEDLSLGYPTLRGAAGENYCSTSQTCNCSTEQIRSMNSTTDGINKSEGSLAKEEGNEIQVEGEEKGKSGCSDLLGHKASLPGLSSSHSASHPDLHSQNLSSLTSSSSFPVGKNVSSPLHNMASSSLHNIIQRRKLGADLYSSDPQLAVQTQNLPEEPQQREKDLAEGKRLVKLRSSTTLGSRESLLASGPTRSVRSGFERRGSAAFFLDYNSQSRPRSLPPLNINSPNAHIPNMYDPSSSGRGFCGTEAGLKTLIPSAPPGPPREPTRAMLLRRHSMQTEQFKTKA